MKNTVRPYPNTVHPIKEYDREIYVKPTINNPIPILTCSDLEKVKEEIQKGLLIYEQHTAFWRDFQG